MWEISLRDYANANDLARSNAAWHVSVLSCDAMLAQRIRRDTSFVLGTDQGILPNTMAARKDVHMEVSEFIQLAATQACWQTTGPCSTVISASQGNGSHAQSR